MHRETLIREYRYYLKIERALSPHTVASYVSDVSAFLEDVAADAERVTADDIIGFLGSRTLSKRSQARLLSALRSFFGWMVLEGHRTGNPCDGIDSPKLGRYLPAVLSVGEVEALLDSVDGKAPNGLRDRAILEVLYGCGLRVSEAAALRVSDFFMDEGFVRIIGKGDKQRLVPVGEPARAAVQDYLAGRPQAAPGYEDYLFLNRFGKPLSRVSLFQLVKKQALLAGITKEISPHTFRHSFATHLVENGADLRVVQEMLGHESILTTEIYTHIDKKTWQQEVLLHHPINTDIP